MSNESTSLWSHKASRIFIGVCLWNTVAYGLLFNSFGLFVKPIATEFTFTIAAVSLIATISAVGGAIFLNLAGRFMNRVPSRIWFTSVAIGLSLVYVGFSQVNELWQFYALGACYSILAGLGIFITAQLIIPNWFAYSATYLGVAAGCSGVGAMIGAPILNFIISSQGYSLGFLFSAGVAFVTLVPLGFFVLKSHPQELDTKPYQIEKFEAEKAARDAKGAQGGEKQIFNGYSEAQVRKMPHWWLFWLAVILTPILGAIFMHVPGALEDKGLSVVLLGTVVAFYHFGVMVGQMSFGWFSERFGMIAVSVIWPVLAISCCLGLAFLSQPIVWLLALLVFVLGFQRALGAVGIPVFVRHLFGMKDYGKILSTYYTVFLFAAAAYVTFMGWLKDVTGTYNIVFLIIAGVGVALLLVLLTVLYLGRKQESKRLSGEWKPTDKP